MTQNQIAYWELEEKKRSNRVQEVETKRHNMQTEFVQAGTLDENKRHNLVSEGLAFGNLAETERSNKAREAENERSNKANEALKHESNMYTREVGMAQVAESRRHNTATENEQARHDMATEEFSYYNTNVNRQLQEHGYQIQEDKVLIEQGNLDLKREQVYGGTYSETGGGSSGFSSAGRGSDAFTKYRPTLEREIKEHQLHQDDIRVIQNWFSVGGQFMRGSSNLVDTALNYLVK